MLKCQGHLHPFRHMTLPNTLSRQELPPNGKRHRWPSSCMRTNGLQKTKRKLQKTPGWSLLLYSAILSRTDLIVTSTVFVGFPGPTATPALPLWNSFRQFYVRERLLKRWLIWGGRMEGGLMLPKRKLRLFAVLRDTTGSCGSWLQYLATCSFLLWSVPSSIPTSYLSDFPCRISYARPRSIYCFLF